MKHIVTDSYTIDQDERFHVAKASQLLYFILDEMCVMNNSTIDK